MPESTDAVSGPLDREKAISAAFFRLLDQSQKDAAAAAGIGERTLRQYETCSWWPEILQVASDRWLSGLTAKARVGLQEGVLTDGKLALSVLERLDERLRPPKVRSEVTGKDGGPIETTVTDAREKLERQLSDVRNRIGAHLPKQNGSSG